MQGRSSIEVVINGGKYLPESTLWSQINNKELFSTLWFGWEHIKSRFAIEKHGPIFCLILRNSNWLYIMYVVHYSSYLLCVKKDKKNAFVFSPIRLSTIGAKMNTFFFHFYTEWIRRVVYNIHTMYNQLLVLRIKQKIGPLLIPKESFSSSCLNLVIVQQKKRVHFASVGFQQHQQLH